MAKTLTIRCPICGGHDLEVSVTHDLGVWRTANGDGWPEHWEVDWAHDLHPAQTDAEHDRVFEAATQAYYDEVDNG